MFADGYMIGDGSWELKIFVTDLKVERTLRVKGDLHVGGLMLKLVEDLGTSYTLGAKAASPLSLCLLVCRRRR